MKLNKKDIISYTKWIGACGLSMVAMLLAYKQGSDEGFEDGSKYGGQAVLNAGRAKYDDFDEKMNEYISENNEKE